MASFDLASRILPAVSIVPQTLGTSNVNSEPIDTQGFESFAYVFAVGSGNTTTTNSAALVFYESDDNTRGNAEPVPTNRGTSNPVVDKADAVVP